MVDHAVQHIMPQPFWKQSYKDTKIISSIVSGKIARVTYPTPVSTIILSLKSTEFKLSGFHFKTSSHLPAMYD